MKERLIKNWGLKILSIFLAFFLWFLVVNEANPVKTKRVDGVVLDIINSEVLTDAELTFEIGKKTISIYVDVKTLDENKIRASDFRAYIDMKDLWPVTGTVPVRIEVLNNQSLLQGSPVARPENVQVRTEKIQNKTFNVKAETVGTPEDGNLQGSITVSPESVVVRGPESKIGQINYVGIKVNLEGASNSIEGTAPVVLFDGNGKELNFGDDVTIDTESISFYQEIMKIKDLNLNFNVTGEVADGFKFVGTACDLKSVPVYGMKSVLANLTTITVEGPELSVEGARGDKTIKVDLSKYLPSSEIGIVGLESSIVEVTMKVEGMEVRDYKIPLSQITVVNASDDYEYEYSTKEITVKVRGLKEDLDLLKAEDIKPVLDLKDLKEGNHPGTLAITLDQSFEMRSYDSFMVTVSVSEEETTSDEDSSADEAAATQAHAQETTKADTPEGSTSEAQKKSSAEGTGGGASAN